MLVLSRRKNETIVFPSINATVELLQIQGNVARIGIDAPREVPVVRGELIENDSLDPASNGNSPANRPAQKAADPLSHSVRNLLNTTTVGLSLLSRQLREGMVGEAEETIRMVLEKVEEMKEKAQHDKQQTQAQRRRALLVEDDANERQLLAGYLRTRGFAVDTAVDGVEAIEFLDSHEKPDVVLMDMRLPRCSGNEAVRVIRQNPQHDGLKIFAVSGSTQSENVLNGYIDRWFQKPLDPEAFVDAISHALCPSTS